MSMSDTDRLNAAERTTEFVIIFGPPASGKSINAKALMHHFACDAAYDAGFDDAAIMEAKGRVMVMTHDPSVKGVRGARRLFDHATRVSIVQARQELGERWIEPKSNHQSSAPTEGPRPGEHHIFICEVRDGAYIPLAQWRMDAPPAPPALQRGGKDGVKSAAAMVTALAEHLREVVA